MGKALTKNKLAQWGRASIY